MIAGIVHTLTQFIAVTVVLVGVVIVLLAIHYGAEFLFGKDYDKNGGQLKEDMEKENEGISKYNVFYRFFFRNRED